MQLMTVIRCIRVMAFMGLLMVSGMAFAAGSVSITSPNNLAIFQHNGGVADIPVSVSATGVPVGGGIWFVLDGDTPKQVSGVRLTTPYTYIFRNVKLGEHTLDAYMIDSKGNLVGPSDTRHRIGVGDIIVCVGDSITAGENDNITSDDWSADGRNGPYVDPIDGLAWGGFEPILNNLLTEQRGYPHSVINQGMGTETTAGGINRLPGILANYGNANTWLIAYGTNDIHVGISPSTYVNNLRTMVDMITSKNPKASVYIPKILYGGQANIGKYLDYMGNMIYYTDYNLHWGADLYTMFQSNFNKYNYRLGLPGSWYSTDPVPHPNGLGYQQIAECWELALVYNAFIVTDGSAASVGRIWADKIQLDNFNKIGLSRSNLMVVCADTPSSPFPAGTYYAPGGWSVYLDLTQAADFTGGGPTATVRLEPWDLSNSGATSWNQIWLSCNSTLLPTTRSVFSQYNQNELFSATVPHIGQLVPVVKN